MKIDCEKMLKGAGLKVTDARRTILSILATEHTPLTVERICARLAGESVNQVTVYRTLASLERAGIVHKVELGIDAAAYELVVGRRHHHHIVCSLCGVIEDIRSCLPQEFERSIVRASRGFSEISRHSLEFFGTCKKCARA